MSDDATRRFAANQFVYDDDLATLPHIDPATKDHLALEFDVTSECDLRAFIEEASEAFKAIFGAHGETIREALAESS